MDRDKAHWTHEDHKQRMTTKQWRELLLKEDDRVIFRGRLRTLKAKNIGAGVVEIYKVPLEEGN